MMMATMIKSRVPNPTHNPMISRLLPFSASVPPVVPRMLSVPSIGRAVEVGEPENDVAVSRVFFVSSVVWAVEVGELGNGVAVSRVFFVSSGVRAVEVGVSILVDVDELLSVENGVVVVRSGREVVDHGGVAEGDSVSVRVEVIVLDGVV